MRLAKLLLAGLIAAIAIMGGLLAAALVALLGIVGLIAHRFLPRPAASGTSRSTAPSRRPPARMSAEGAIDVTATEVPVDSEKR